MAAWIKSTYSASDSDACVEVLRTNVLVSVRDSKNPDGPRFAVSPDGWRTFLSAITHR